MKILHLVLTYHWYDETIYNNKRIEYRKKSSHWIKNIWNKRSAYTHVRFSRGYTSKTALYRITEIDKGKCFIKGWKDEYIRIHFEEVTC